MQPVNGNHSVRGGATELRALFAQPGVIRLAGAHNPLGARIAERVGFDGVWSSGLEISASQGLPDTDLLTMSDLLPVAASMAAAVNVPVVADCDAGYGNALNVMHMIRRYEAAGLAAVSIEDKAFPKVNSFIPGRQELSPVDEFCGKIEAAKCAQRTADLMVIARIEALIAERGMDEAVRRGEAYAEAGADAVLIHNKRDSPEPVLEFMRRWRVNLPVVVVPTTYHTITAAELGMAGVKMVIYANHGLRAGISAVSEVFDAILRDGRTTGVEERIAPLSTVFDLQGMARLSEDEKRFVRGQGSRTQVVIVPGMARGGPDPAEASPGRALPELQASVLQDSDLGHIVDVSSADGGPAGPDTAAAVGEVPADFRGRTVVITNDVFVDVEPLRWLATSTADIAILVSAPPQAGRPSGGVPVSLSAKAVRGRRLGGRGGCLVTGFDSQPADAEFVGVVAFSPRGFTALQEAAEKRRTFHDRPTRLVDLLRDLMGTGWAIRAMEITGGWAEVRTQEDLRQVSALVAGQATA
jgi:phosphoenolpyruvate phosphomutase